MEVLKLRRDRRRKTVEAALAQLRAQRFKYVPPLPMLSSLASSISSGIRPRVPDIDGNVWRVDEIMDNGALSLNGGGRVVGEILRGLSVLRPPPLDTEVMLQLLSAAITISFIGFMEAISIAKAMAICMRHSD